MTRLKCGVLSERLFPLILEIAPRIVIDPAVRFGKPVFRGTWAPVDLVVARLAGGMTAEEVAEEFDLAPEDIQAALAYAGPS